MGKNTVVQKNIFYPPGGLLIWLIVLLELLTFGMGIVVMNHFEKSEIEIFNSSRKLLNQSYGLSNTLVLLTSGFFMAQAVFYSRKGNGKLTSKNIYLCIGLGLVFLVIKGFEYHQKYDSALTISTNTFFTFYYLLTGFHVIHVIFGIAILIFFLSRNSSKRLNIEDLEAGAIFWHMCDLIWLIIFPFIYLK